jgi:hypothetical protein
LSWAKISFVVRRDDGIIVDTELLRPWSWVESLSLQPGHSINIHVPELQVHGIATVTGLETCPPLADGDGEVVTGRYITRKVAATTRITLEGGSVVEGTPIHPIWSVDREDWVPLGELTVGEQLLGRDGPVKIIASEVVHKPTRVYNLEVNGEHVYQIGDLRVLVHNAGDLCGFLSERFKHFSTSPAGVRLFNIAKSYRALLGGKSIAGRNIAVADVIIDGVPKTVKFLNTPKLWHSEERLIKWVELMSSRGKTVEVLRVFSDRIPCGANRVNCAQKLLDAFGPEVDVYYNVIRGLI